MKRHVGAERRDAIVSEERLCLLLKPTTVRDGVGVGSWSTSITMRLAQLEGLATSGARGEGGQGPWPCSSQNGGSHGGHGPGLCSGQTGPGGGTGATTATTA